MSAFRCKDSFDDLADFFECLYGRCGEHPDYPSSEWRDVVIEEDTRFGYWLWVAHMVDTRSQIQ